MLREFQSICITSSPDKERSVVEGPFHFDPITLTSALRIATTYDHPALRNFAIKHLENALLSAVERIRLAREFGLPSWEEPAYVELCNRDEAVTKEEASVLGLDAFVHVARIREKEQRRRGREVDCAAESDKECAMGEEPATNSSGTKGKGKDENGSTSVTPELDVSVGEQDQAKKMLTETNKKGEGELYVAGGDCILISPPFAVRQVGTIPTSSFIGVETTGTHWRSHSLDTLVLDVPGCECTRFAGRRCALPPCVASVIKHLQTQQLAHNAGISNLESTIGHAKPVLTPFATPEPQVDLDSDEPSQTGYVEEEVRKWLAGIEFHPMIA